MHNIEIFLKWWFLGKATLDLMVYLIEGGGHPDVEKV
jgi:hypothetical protein